MSVSSLSLIAFFFDIQLGYMYFAINVSVIFHKRSIALAVRTRSVEGGLRGLAIGGLIIGVSGVTCRSCALGGGKRGVTRGRPRGVDRFEGAKIL